MNSRLITPRESKVVDFGDFSGKTSAGYKAQPYGNGLALPTIEFNCVIRPTCLC
jgi:hypothetical protein